MSVKRLLMMIVALLAFATVSAQEQDLDLAVILINSTTHELVRVAPDGTMTSYMLDLPEDVYVGAGDIAFNADASLAAFCISQYNQGADPSTPLPPTVTLYVRDLIAGTTLVQEDMGAPMACRVSPEGFSEDGTRVSVGIISYLSGDPTADSSQPPWRLLVVDAQTGDTVSELNTQSDAFTAALTADVESGGVYMPDVRRFDGENVYFALVNWFTEGMQQYSAYSWNVGENTVIFAPEWGLGQTRLITTGGLNFAYTDLDDTLPAAESGGPVGYSNMLRVGTSAEDAAPVYFNTEEVIGTAQFINGGNQLAVLLVEALDPNNVENVQQSRWIALNRDGSVSDLTPPGTDYVTVRNAPGGYLIVTRVYNVETNEQSMTVVYNSASGEARTVWEHSGTSDTGYWDVAWVTPSAVIADADLPPFPLATAQ